MAQKLKIKEPKKDNFQLLLENFENLAGRFSAAETDYQPENFGLEFLACFSFPKKNIGNA